jgi:hypothetical protein
VGVGGAVVVASVTSVVVVLDGAVVVVVGSPVAGAVVSEVEGPTSQALSISKTSTTLSNRLANFLNWDNELFKIITSGIAAYGEHLINS